MSNSVVAFQDSSAERMSPAVLTSRLALIQDTMRTAMKKGVDYGAIPGTGTKPTLLKPGAEKLCALFSIGPDYVVEDLSTLDCIRIRVKCIGRQHGTDVVLSAGVGECSTNEEKYKWRAPVCAQEFDETPEDRRRSKWKHGRGGKPYRADQIRTEPADLANTVLKMASKRAHIAMTLNFTGASAIFTQDVEELPREMRPAGVDEDGVIADVPVEARKTPQPRADATGAITESQRRMLQRKLDDASMSAQTLCERFKVAALTELQFNDLNAALAYVADSQLHEGKQ